MAGKIFFICCTTSSRNGTTEVDEIELVSSYSIAKSQQIYNYIQRKCANESIDSDDENKVKITRGLLRKTPPSLKAARKAILVEFEEVIQCPDSHQKLKENLRYDLRFCFNLTELQHHLAGFGSSSLSSLPVTENVSTALQSEIETEKYILPDHTPEKKAVTTPDQWSVEVPLPSVLKEVPLPKSSEDRSVSSSRIEPLAQDCEMETEKCTLLDNAPEKTAATIPDQRSVEAPLPSIPKDVPLPESPEDRSDSLSQIEHLAQDCEMEIEKCTLFDKALEKTAATIPDQRCVEAPLPSVLKEVPLPKSSEDRSVSSSRIEPLAQDCEMETEKCTLLDNAPEKTAATIPDQRSVEAPLPSIPKDVPLPESPEDRSDSLSQIEHLAQDCEMEIEKCTLFDKALEKTAATIPDQRCVEAPLPSVFKEVPLPKSVSASENFILPLDSPKDKMYFPTPQTTNPSQPLSQAQSILEENGIESKKCIFPASALKDTIIKMTTPQSATAPVATCSNEPILLEHAGESTPHAVPIEDYKKNQLVWAYYSDKFDYLPGIITSIQKKGANNKNIN
uniref:Uncharacterized protein n=1 Tax=Trichogramma kaykai TaxID=54128 RepID=A0ABD2WEK2_9HYME